MVNVAKVASTGVDLAQERWNKSLSTTGQLLRLAIEALVAAFRDIVRGEFSWTEFFLQSWFMVRVALAPAILVSIPFGIIVAVQVGGVANQIGAISFIGAVNGIGVLRQGAPLVTSVLLAGAVGSAMTADIGARTIRDEVDAMRVMGISPVNRLVAPRLIAAIGVGMFLNVIVAITAMISGFSVAVGSGAVSSGSYISAFVSFAQPTDLLLAGFKAVLFALVAVIVSCHKGLSASGGPKGVADAVNQSVVLSMIMLALINTGLTQAYTLVVPSRIG